MTKGINIAFEDDLYNFTSLTTMSISSLGKPFKATKEIDLGMMQVLGVHTTWSPCCQPQLQIKSLQTIFRLYI